MAWLRRICVRCAVLAFAFVVCLSLASCGDDDDDTVEEPGYVGGGSAGGSDTGGNSGGGSQGGQQQVSASDLVGRTFYCSESFPDGQGNVDMREYTVEFTTTTECHLTHTGYEWEWLGGRWQQEFFNDDADRTYTVSGGVIKIARYPFLGGGTLELIYRGSYLSNGGSMTWHEI